MNPKSHSGQLAREAKVIVALAFRNGPIENVHAGKLCPTCEGQSGFSRITDAEMKLIMKSAVDQVYALLCLKTENPAAYEARWRISIISSRGYPYDHQTSNMAGGCFRRVRHAGRDVFHPGGVQQGKVAVGG
jgi:hypothetical protein